MGLRDLPARRVLVIGRMRLRDLAAEGSYGCGQNGVKGLSHQKGPMGVGRMGLRDLSCQEGPGCGYLWRQNGVNGLEPSRGLRVWAEWG